MRTNSTIQSRCDDRYLVIDDTDEDFTQILQVICDGDPRTNRGFDFDAYARGDNA